MFGWLAARRNRVTVTMYLVSWILIILGVLIGYVSDRYGCLLLGAACGWVLAIMFLGIVRTKEKELERS